MDRLESFGHLREVDSEAHRVTAVISTGDVARDGAIIDPAGWDFSNYDRNPVVLWMHNDGAMPFARTTERMATDKELIARAEFDMEDPLGATAFRKISNGYVNATSVRWLPKRTEMRKRDEDGEDDDKILVFVEQELLEWSFVTIPADPGATILRADGGPFALADYVKPDSPPVADLELPSEMPGDEFILDWPDTLSAERNGNGHHADPNQDFAALEALLVRYFERRNQRLDPDDMVVNALSRATGKSVERVRQDMAAGG